MDSDRPSLLTEDDQEENRRQLAELSAKPWRGACSLCIGILWCTDTEEEALHLVEEHVAAEHKLVCVWRDHE